MSKMINGKWAGRINLDTVYVFNKLGKTALATDRINFNENPIADIYLDDAKDFPKIKDKTEKYITMLITSSGWRKPDYYKKSDLDTINIFIPMSQIDLLIGSLLRVKKLSDGQSLLIIKGVV